MGHEDAVVRITELLLRTDEAHRKYLNRVLGVRDDTAWPEWYAEYLIGHGFDMIVDDRLAAELLVGFLTRCRDEHEACGSEGLWIKFTESVIGAYTTLGLWIITKSVIICN